NGIGFQTMVGFGTPDVGRGAESDGSARARRQRTTIAAARMRLNGSQACHHPARLSVSSPAVTVSRYRPIDSRIYPRFAGVRTFRRRPHVTAPSSLDAAAVGIPFDTATSFRRGARFGPEAIRSASALLRPYHPTLDIDVLEAISVADYGDLPVAPGDTEGT